MLSNYLSSGVPLWINGWLRTSKVDRLDLCKQICGVWRKWALSDAVTLGIDTVHSVHGSKPMQGPMLLGLLHIWINQRVARALRMPQAE